MPRKLCGEGSVDAWPRKRDAAKGRCSAGPRVSYEHTENADSAPCLAEFPKERTKERWRGRFVQVSTRGAIQVQSRRFGCKYLL